MADEEKKGKGGCLGWVVIGILLVGVFLFGGKELKKMQEGGELSDELKTPETTARYYAKMAGIITSGQLKVNDLLAAVTKDDKKWFLDNQDKIYDSCQGDLNKFIGYNAPSGGQVEKAAFAIMHVLSSSPQREDVLLTVTSNDGKKATVEAKQGNAYGTFRNYEMELVKEGKVWKVSGFCGARAEIEKEMAGK